MNACTKSPNTGANYIGGLTVQEYSSILLSVSVVQQCTAVTAGGIHVTLHYNATTVVSLLAVQQYTATTVVPPLAIRILLLYLYHC